MSAIFRIDSSSFEFSEATSVTFQDGGMSFRLQSVPVPFDESLHPPIFSPESDAPRLIAPSFFAPTFYFYDNHEPPRRIIRCPQRLPTTSDFHLFEKGFAFGVRFFGSIDLTSSCIELCGVLRRDYEPDETGVSLHLVWHFPPGTLLLRPHTYGSVAEAMSMPPERVRRLLVSSWNGFWLREILKFKQLEYLSLQYVSYEPSADETVWPEAFCELAHLRELYVRGAGFRRLPDRFGDLAALEVLSLQYGRLAELPAGVKRLTRLQRLLLDDNNLTALPESIGQLPALALLSINANPFKSLPTSLAKIKTVIVERKNEALFRDASYRPDVAIAVDRECLMARSSQRHVALLGGALNRYGLMRYEAALLRHARQALRLRTTELAGGAPLGASRIGGTPDLPPGVEYPKTDGRHWHFYAQIDLDIIAELQSFLPRTGRLYFFGEGQERGDRALVLHSAASAALLRSYSWPDDLEFLDGTNDVYKGYDVRVDSTVSVPSLYNAHHRFTADDAILMEIADDDALKRAYWALEAELAGDGEERHGAHLMNAHVFTQCESPEEQASRENGGLPSEWVNLLILDSDLKPGFCFWDAGTLTFTIHEKDLVLADFSKVCWSLESS